MIGGERRRKAAGVGTVVPSTCEGRILPHLPTYRASPSIYVSFSQSQSQSNGSSPSPNRVWYFVTGCRGEQAEHPACHSDIQAAVSHTSTVPLRSALMISCYTLVLQVFSLLQTFTLWSHASTNLQTTHTLPIPLVH